MILREIFVRTIPFGEEYIFLMGNHWAFFGFCVLFLLFKGCLKVWMMVWLLFCVLASRLGTQVHINNRVASYLLSGYSEMAKKQ